MLLRGNLADYCILLQFSPLDSFRCQRELLKNVSTYRVVVQNDLVTATHYSKIVDSALLISAGLNKCRKVRSLLKGLVIPP
jgi:hypothetical protein